MRGLLRADVNWDEAGLAGEAGEGVDRNGVSGRIPALDADRVGIAL